MKTRKTGRPEIPGREEGVRPSEGPRRLNAILSAAGLTSRRQADTWILGGRVRVNGEIVRELGVKALWGKDRIQVDGKDIPKPVQRLYLVLNKPFGVICALKDPEGRPVVTDLLRGLTQRVFPVGRLDFDTMGLLLLTNDGAFAARLLHPRYKIPRTYKATVTGEVPEEALDRLRQGIRLEDGAVARARVQKVGGQGGRQTLLRMTITEGRNRQVRKMLEALGYKVEHLIRIGFGSLVLGDLKVGDYRFLEGQEVQALQRLVQLP